MPDDAKHFLNMTLDDLKTGEPAEPAAVKPGATDDTGPASKPAVKPDAKPAAKPPSVEELLAKNPTPEGRKAIAKKFGITLADESLPVDDVIDIPNREEVDSLTKMLGGPEAMPDATEAFRQAMGLVGVGLDNYDELVEGMTPEEEHAEIVETVKEWNEVLANPMKSQALLQKIYAHPMQEPGRSYFMGKGSPALNEAIARLWATTTGEKYVRPKSKGDGHSY